MALAALEDLKARLEWELDADETRAAHAALEDLSDQALHYGRSTWTAATVPALVRNTILAATTRYLRNPDGYTQSRAGDETLTWTDRGHDAGTAYFTDRETKLIQGFAGRAGIGSIPVVAWGNKRRYAPGYVPVQGGGDPFPLYADEIEPW
jgi:hypothetical protein